MSRIKPALRVRSLAWKIRVASELAPFHSAQTGDAFPRISLRSLTGFKGERKTRVIVIPRDSEESFFDWKIHRIESILFSSGIVMHL